MGEHRCRTKKRSYIKYYMKKIWVIMQKIKTNKRIKTYKGIEAEKKEQGITKSV